VARQSRPTIAARLFLNIPNGHIFFNNLLGTIPCHSQAIQRTCSFPYRTCRSGLRCNRSRCTRRRPLYATRLARSRLPVDQFKKKWIFVGTFLIYRQAPPHQSTVEVSLASKILRNQLYGMVQMIRHLTFHLK
jgi:hypothetical protein